MPFEDTPTQGTFALNSLLTLLGIEAWKPVLTALFLPPVPFLLLILIGARLILPRRGLGWFVIVLSVTGLWLTATSGTGRFLDQFALRVPPQISTDRLAELRARAPKNDTAIVVLGAGAEPLAPEYGVTNLTGGSLERLRYAMHLSRETGLPIAFSGGVGWSQSQSGSEAEAAARIAAQDYGRPLKWTETQSRDTRENAALTIPMLKRVGITRVVLVTHGWHMPRAKKLFDEVAGPQGITVDAAPMGLARRVESTGLDWLPTSAGFVRVRNAIKEWVAGVVAA